jgi:hypothetical protein
MLTNCFATFGHNLFAGSTSGVYLSTNNGTSWTANNSGLLNVLVNPFLSSTPEVDALVVSGTNLFAGIHCQGVWRRPVSEMITSVDRPNTDLPTKFSLDQNYPNPFNPSTTISFNLPSRSFVSLKVYNLLGKEVASIVSKILSTGNYTRQWNAVGMPSGVYFYRLQAGSFTETKKLLLLR